MPGRPGDYILNGDTEYLWPVSMELKDLEEVGKGCGDWMELAQDRDRWRGLVSTVMNFRVP